MKLHPVDELFEILEKRVKPYPKDKKVVDVPELVSGFTFFPGDGGLYGRVALNTPVKWPELQRKPKMPIKGVMVLGNNLYNLKGYQKNFEKTRIKGETPSTTWRNLKTLLSNANVPLEKCFFTNAYMGLGDVKSANGEFPGASCPDFTLRCKEFFYEQLRIQQPRLILALGKDVMEFLAPLANELQIAWRPNKTGHIGGFEDLDEEGNSLVKDVSFGSRKNPIVVLPLTHPSYPVNVKYRRFKGFEPGKEAETALVKQAFKLAGIE